MVRFFVDDAISLEAMHEQNGERCLELTAALASTHHVMLGERGEGEEQVLAKKKMKNWKEREVVLGWVVDTRRGTLSLQEERVAELREMLEQWPSTRTHATVKEVLVLAGKLHHAAFVIRPGRYFVRRLLQLAGLHLNGVERAGGGDAWGRERKRAQAKRVLTLDEEFMADVGWWRWYMEREEKEVGGEIAAPSFSFAQQIASRTVFSDASTKRVGGVCMEKRWYWFWTLPQEVERRTIAHRKHGEGDFMDINLLELLGVVVSAYVLVEMTEDRPGRKGEAVMMRADNTRAVGWVRKCRGGKKDKARVGALMRWLGVLESKGEWCFQAKHVPGVENTLADGLTRWKVEEIPNNLQRESPGTPWQVKELGEEELRVCSEILREATHLDELQRRLGQLMKDVGGCG